MADEALWVQNAPYEAAEDRKIIAAIWNAGVINGLTIAAGTGLAVTVAPGRCVVPFSDGTSVLVVISSAQIVSGLTASASQNIYVVVDPNTGNWSLVKGTTPSNPYLLIGSATTSGSAVSSVSNVRASATSPLAVADTAKEGVFSGTTDANGLVSVTHGLGSVPRIVLAVMDESTTSARACPLMASVSATTFQVRARNGDSGASMPTTNIKFSWRVAV